MSQGIAIESLPIRLGGESFEVLIAASVQSCVGSPKDPPEIEESLFLDAVIFQELRVVAKVSEKPIESPQSFLRAVQTTRERASFKGLRFQNRELEFYEGLVWMPPVPCSLHANKEQAFKLTFDSALIEMKARNLSFHEFTSTGLE
jgi:hypothetical protein